MDSTHKASIVDVRPVSSFLLRHLRGSVSFELASLGVGGGEGTRATELPSRSWPIALKVMGTTLEEKNLGITWLETHGWKVNRQESLVETDVDWITCENVEIGKGTCQFWKASPVLESHGKWLFENSTGSSQPVAIDLGCGSGRDAVFLARLGFKVLALDREPTFLVKTQRFAEREGVDHVITTMKADLRPQFLDSVLKPLLVQFQEGGGVILLSRFMNRPLLQYLAEHTPKSWFVAIHHFLVGATSRTGNPFRKGSDQTLERGELRDQFFPSPHFTCVLNQEEAELADGRPVLNFIAQKKI